MSRKQRVLVVEDEVELLKGLAFNLELEGFEVLEAGQGDRAIALAVERRPDLVLLDVMLPGTNGFDVCRELRKRGVEVPIILLTARSEEIDRVVGLEIGADDYVTKPFSMRELVARIRVRLRRTAVGSQEGPSTYRLGDVEVDFEKHRALRSGEPLELSAKEIEILRCLIRRRGEVVSRDELLDEVWGYEAYPSTRTVDNHILKLRKKIEEDPASPRLILSVYGEGYKLVG